MVGTVESINTGAKTMRKIEKQTLEAIKANRNFKSGNTEVRSGTVYLHGNKIAERQGNRLILDTVTLHRWPTVTTRSRLNALGFSVCQRNYEQIIDCDTVEL